ncbi:hypothetical protein [Streptomyces sp. NPDC004135]
MRGWVKRAETGEDPVSGTTIGDAARIAELEREVKELRRANAIAVRAMSNSPRRYATSVPTTTVSMGPARSMPPWSATASR